MPAAALRSAAAVLQSPPPASGHDPAFRAADPSCPCPGAAPRADAISGTTCKMKMPFAAKSIRSAYGEAPAATETPGSCPVPGVGQVRAPGDGLKAAGAPPHVTRGNMRPAAPTRGTSPCSRDERTCSGCLPSPRRARSVRPRSARTSPSPRSPATSPGSSSASAESCSSAFRTACVRPRSAPRRWSAPGASSHEAEAAERAIEAARSGRTGVFRVTATPPWTETVLARAAARFRETFPAVELRIGSATRAEGLRRLADGRLRPALRRHRHRRTPAGVPAPRAFPRHDRRHRRLARSPAVRRIRRP